MRIIFLLTALLIPGVGRAQFKSDSTNHRVTTSSVIVGDTTAGPTSETVIKPSKPFLENAFAGGVTLGLPGGLNVIAQKYFGKLGISAEVGGFAFIFFSISGYQGNITWNLDRTENAALDFGFIGYSSISSSVDDFGPEQVRMAGISLRFLGGGFFMELSAGETWTHHFGTNTNSPQLHFPASFQIGYLH